MAATRRRKTKKSLRSQAPPQTGHSDEYSIAFVVEPETVETLSKFAAAIQEREGGRVSVHQVARRILHATLVHWGYSIDTGEVDLSDPSWRPPC